MVYSETERVRVQDDLRGLVAGDVRGDPLFCSLYASDGSILWQEPLAVVRPSRVEDIIACVRYAGERKIPLIPRGAGSGTAGGAIGPGIVIDLSRYFRRITRTGDSRFQVAAGATIERINHALASSGQHLPWKTTGGLVSTIGGLLARGELPWASLHYGNWERYVVSIQVVLADGSLVDLPNRPISVDEAFNQGKNGAQWWRQLAQILQLNAKVIAEEQSTREKSWCGFRLKALCGDVEWLPSATNEANTQQAAQADLKSETDSPFGSHDWAEQRGGPPSSRLASLIEEVCASDLSMRGNGPLPVPAISYLWPARLFVASEGTLGIITQVELEPPLAPPATGSAVFFFEDLGEVLQASEASLIVDPAGIGLLDHRHLSLLRESEPKLAPLVPREACFALFVELEGQSGRDLRDKIDGLRAAVQSVARTLGPGASAIEPWDRQIFECLKDPVPAALYRYRTGGRPVPFVDAVAIPQERLANFLSDLFACLRRAELTAAVYCHSADGRVFIRPIADLSDRHQRTKLLSLAEEIFQTVLEHHGSITAGGGWGLIRTPYLEWQYPRLSQVFLKVKRILDPENILNPGKVVAGQSREEFRALFSSGAILREARGEEVAPLQDRHQETKRSRKRTGASLQTRLIKEATQSLKPLAITCFACGGCRHQWHRGRMCPVFRFLPAEEASPRAKANLLLGLLSQENISQQIATTSLREIAELCVHCHMCQAECPAAVGVPELMVELKGQHAASAGLLFSDWVMARLDLFAGLALKAPRVANWALRTGWVRWLLEKLVGLAQGRYIPPVASRSFLHLAAKNRWTVPARHRGPAVAYFVDLFVNYFDPQLGELFAKVLQHNGMSIFVPEKQQQAGVAAITCGALDIARRLVRRNSRVLAQAIRMGYRVVATEPAAALALKKEYPLLDPSADTQLVAENVTEACAFLWTLHLEGRLQLDFRPIPLNVGYHEPCRSRALGGGRPAENLLRLIPGLQILPIPDGCSGMAGTVGLKAANYRASLRGGFPLVAALRQPQYQVAVTECSACKIQLLQGTGKPVLHPIELLACAYGFVPLESLLQRGDLRHHLGAK